MIGDLFRTKIILGKLHEGKLSSNIGIITKKG
jgi:hypothetical protein